MKKEARVMEKAILLTCEKSGLELSLAFAAGLLGNLAAKKADWPKELAWRAELPEEGISR
jgi:hypothetical protein